jgi:hypothetical protein
MLARAAGAARISSCRPSSLPWTCLRRARALGLAGTAATTTTRPCQMRRGSLSDLLAALLRSGLEVVDASLQQHARAELISAVVAATCSSGVTLRFRCASVCVFVFVVALTQRTAMFRSYVQLHGFMDCTCVCLCSGVVFRSKEAEAGWSSPQRVGCCLGACLQAFCHHVCVCGQSQQHARAELISASVDLRCALSYRTACVSCTCVSCTCVSCTCVSCTCGSCSLCLSLLSVSMLSHSGP